MYRSKMIAISQAIAARLGADFQPQILQALSEEFAEQIAIFWHLDDIIDTVVEQVNDSLFDGVAIITNEQFRASPDRLEAAHGILKKLLDEHDGERGVSWSTVQGYIDQHMEDWEAELIAERSSTDLRKFVEDVAKTVIPGEIPPGMSIYDPSDADTRNALQHLILAARKITGFEPTAPSVEAIIREVDEGAKSFFCKNQKVLVVGRGTEGWEFFVPSTGFRSESAADVIAHIDEATKCKD